MDDFCLDVGLRTTFSKTVSESDVYLFAGITGDFSPNHVNRAHMADSSYGRPIAHGALIVGYMSAASTLATAQCNEGPETPVSLGYDRIRFLAPVFFGDTITVDYTVTHVDPERRRATSEIAVVNQQGETVAVAQHILKWVAK